MPSGTTPCDCSKRWSHESGDNTAAASLAQRAEHTCDVVQQAFLVVAEGGYLYDVVDGENGDDTALRPNQVLAISLDHPVLDHGPLETGAREGRPNTCRRPSACEAWPRGIPTISRTYDGDLRARDAAYHQGTVWAWLIGPFIDAWLACIRTKRQRPTRC